VSTNIEERINTHNRGKGAKYTRARLPVKLVYSEAVSNRSEAQQREHAIKKMSALRKRALAEAYTDSQFQSDKDGASQSQDTTLKRA